MQRLKQAFRRHQFALWLTIVSASLVGSQLCAICRGQTLLLQSAQLGTTGRYGGASITHAQHIGWRFNVDQLLQIRRVGGHMLRFSDNPGEMFAALVRLPSIDAFPVGSPLTPEEVVAVTTLRPNFPSDEVLTPLATVLNPGSYALVFGTNLFGATGAGAMHNGPDQPDIPPTDISSFVFWGIVRPDAPPEWRTNLASNMRFVIEAEPFHPTADFDNDHDVDSDDLAQWSNDFGIGADSDADEDDDSDGVDYLAWQRQFGFAQTAPPENGLNHVPEPSGLLLGSLFGAGALGRRQRRAKHGG